MKKLITIFLVIVISAIIALIIFSYLRDKKTKSILTAGIVQGTEVNLGELRELSVRLAYMQIDISGKYFYVQR